jgi:4-amino-4-deoxy-L-arabinose transferase-like glycosyltransferase
MESIPTAYLVVIYTMMALPFIIAILGGISLIVIVTLYFTNRRKTALKMSKVLSIVIILLIAFAWLTKSSLGL